MIQSARIRGVLSPVVTPFKADLAPDDKRSIAHCKWLLSQNCGLAIFGTNSEANSLSIDVLNAVAPVPRLLLGMHFLEPVPVTVFESLFPSL
jgi:hypothetical protein